MHDRTAHEVSFQVSYRILEVFTALNLMSESQQTKAFAAVYAKVRAAIAQYLTEVERLEQRLQPLK